MVERARDRIHVPVLREGTVPSVKTVRRMHAYWTDHTAARLHSNFSFLFVCVPERWDMHWSEHVHVCGGMVGRNLYNT